MHTIGEKRIRMLNPREIKKPEIPLRTDLDTKELSLLRDSISAGGILQPLLVKRVKRGSYQLISGSRRLNAAIMAGLRRVPCVVHNVSATEELLYFLSENLQRNNISVFDEARVIKTLINKCGLTVAETAARLGVSQTTLLSKLQVLRLEERLAKRICNANLGEEYVTVLLRLPPEGRAQALDKIISAGFTVTQAEEYVFSVLNPPLITQETEIKEEAPPKPQIKAAIGDARLFSNSLLKLIDALKEGGVNVKFKKSENESIIEYKIKIKKETAEMAEFPQLKINA